MHRSRVRPEWHRRECEPLDTSRGPYLAQYIDELKRGITSWSPPASSATPRVHSASGVKASVKVGSDNVSTAAVASTSTLLYWFSCTNLTATGIRAQWKSVNGGTCVYRETKLDENDSILSDAVYKADLTLIRGGNVNGLFSIPCSTFSVSRYRPHRNVRPLRSASHVLGLPLRARGMPVQQWGRV